MPRRVLLLERPVSSLARARDSKHLALSISGKEVQLIDLKGKALHAWKTVDEASLQYNLEGHHRLKKGEANPHLYVVQTKKGQETLTPAEFEKRFGWKNDPSKVFVPGE